MVSRLELVVVGMAAVQVAAQEQAPVVTSRMAKLDTYIYMNTYSYTLIPNHMSRLQEARPSRLNTTMYRTWPISLRKTRLLIIDNYSTYVLVAC